MFLRCSFYNDERSRLFKSLSDFSTVNWDPNLSTFKTLLTVGNGDYDFFQANEHLHQWMFREKETCTNSLIIPGYYDVSWSTPVINEFHSHL